MQNPLILYYPHAYPPPILSQSMHANPLFCPTPCMPSPYSVPPHAYPPPILSQPMHTLPPILSQPMHTIPLFYPSPSIPCPLFYPSSCTPLHLFYSTPYMPSPYSIPLYACPLLFSTSPHMPPQYCIPVHTCPPNSLSHEPGRQVSSLTSEIESAHTEYFIIIYLA